MTLSLADYVAIAGLLAVITGTPVTVLVIQLRILNGRVNLQDERITSVQEKHDARIVTLERGKVGKSDWVRETILSRQKLDRLNEQVAELIGRLETQWGVGAAVNRLSDELKASRERDGA